MSALQKITEEQMDAQGVCAAPDVLDGSVADNKAVFDRMVRQIVAPAYNAAVDAVNAISETESGIVAAESGREAAEESRISAENAREAAEEDRAAAETARINAETARAAAEIAREDAETGYIAQAQDQALNAQSWAIGGTNTREGEDSNNAKFYAKQAALLVGGDYANKAVGATAGNLASLSPVGDLVDSGRSIAKTPVSHYVAFRAEDWGADGRITIPAAAHGIIGGDVQTTVSVLLDGVLVKGTWAAAETYAFVDPDTHDIILHYSGYTAKSGGYAGAVLLIG